MRRSWMEVSLSNAKKSMISSKFGNVIRCRNKWNRQKKKNNSWQEEHLSISDNATRSNCQTAEKRERRRRRSSQLDPTHD